MATKTTVNFDDEMEQVHPRRRSQAMLDLIASWEADEGAIDSDHLDWADAILDRQRVSR